jgi:DNA uptake protein ComE-like DNA-binding protein
LIRRFVITELLIGLALSPAYAFAPQSQKLPAQSRATPGSEDRVDINTATLDQLLTVPGMTRVWAARIVRFRPYRAKNDLLYRGVVTSQVYNRIKDYVIAHRPAR